MILDKLENSELYSKISSNLELGLNFLRNTDLKTIRPGRYEIHGNDVFALVSEYDSKKPEDCRLEAHQVYSDIQYLVSGSERIGFESLNGQTELSSYNSEKDIVFYKGEGNPFLLQSGMIAVFFPHDVHRPCIQVAGPEKVKKVVVKVRI